MCGGQKMVDAWCQEGKPDMMHRPAAHEGGGNLLATPAPAYESWVEAIASKLG